MNFNEFNIYLQQWQQQSDNNTYCFIDEVLTNYKDYRLWIQIGSFHIFLIIGCIFLWVKYMWTLATQYGIMCLHSAQWAMRGGIGFFLKVLVILFLTCSHPK